MSLGFSLNKNQIRDTWQEGQPHTPTKLCGMCSYDKKKKKKKRRHCFYVAMLELLSRDSIELAIEETERN